jgi:hypothetical protein
MRHRPPTLPQNFCMDWLKGLTTTAGADAPGPNEFTMSPRMKSAVTEPLRPTTFRKDSTGRPRRVTVSVARMAPLRITARTSPSGMTSNAEISAGSFEARSSALSSR